MTKTSKSLMDDLDRESIEFLAMISKDANEARERFYKKEEKEEDLYSPEFLRQT